MIFPPRVEIGTAALTHSHIQESSKLLTNAGGTSTAIVPAGGAMGDVELMGQAEILDNRRCPECSSLILAVYAIYGNIYH